MAAAATSNSKTFGDTTLGMERRKRRKIEPEKNRDPEPKEDRLIIRWRSAKKQQTYSSKLVEALRNVRRTAPSPLHAYSRPRAVRETADTLLALLAGGRTRWSRAILNSRRKIRLSNHKKAKRTLIDEVRRRRVKVPASGGRTMKRLPALQTRVRDLGRLVPGCRKLPLSNMLEETTDYIAALEMQVRAMAALAEVFFAGGWLRPNVLIRRGMT